MPIDTARTDRPQYTIKFAIGELNLTNKLIDISLINSMFTIYPILYIKLFMDSKEYSINQLYGQQDGLIEFILKNTFNTSEEGIKYNKMDLFIAYIKAPMSLKPDDIDDENKTNSPVEDVVTVIAIPKNCYLAMSTTVNKIFSDNNSGDIIPLNIVNELYNSFISEYLENKISDKNKNNTSLEQVVIPPMSFTSAVKYINDNYSIYNGPLHFYSDINNNLNIWDINKMYSEDVAYTVHFLGLGIKDNKIFEEAAGDDSVIFTYNPIMLKNNVSSKVMNIGKEQIVVKKPKDLFYDMYSTSVEDNVGGENSKLIYNESFKKRKTVYYENVTGETNNNNFINSKINQYLQNCINVSFLLDRSNVSIDILSTIGKPVHLLTYVTSYQKSLEGKYIVASSLLTFKKDASMNFNVNALVNAFRPSSEK